jgi:hypothetical protein
MPAAEMISGTIIGEIRIAMIADLNGHGSATGRSRPSVPSASPIIVATGAIVKEFAAPAASRVGEEILIVLQRIPFRIQRQHLRREGEEVLRVEDSGTITMIGKIRKKKISPQMNAEAVVPGDLRR